MLTIAIAGTAGRKDDAARLSKNLYEAAQKKVEELVKELAPEAHLVSGGAAWADHLAVRLFLQGQAQALTLHLPCPWDKTQFADNGTFDWKTNPGGTANALHRKFQRSTGIHSLQEIADAIAKGATTTVSAGFHARNALMAKSDALIALTFGRGPHVKDGGTAHTCRTYLANVKEAKRTNLSFHIDLTNPSLTAYAGIKI